MKMHQIAAKVAATCAGAVMTIAAAGAGNAIAADTSDMLRVFMNQARILKLNRPVSKVIIGNSGVADATVADAQTIVLTGRAYGTTNLVLLDSAGQPIIDKRVLVSIDEGNTVRVFKQTERSVYSCTPNCERHVDIIETTETTSAPTGM